MAMDVKRDPAILRRKKIRQIALGSVGAVVLLGLTYYVTQLRPAAPLVDSEPWQGTVTVGDFVRDVRGAGTLVPQDIRWIPARTSGRVDKIVLRPGAQVTAGSVILKLSNPDLQQQVRAAELTWRSGQATLQNAKSKLQQTVLTQQANVSTSEQDFKLAQANLDANEELAKQNLISQIVLKQIRSALEQARGRFETAKSQLENTKSTLDSQIAAATLMILDQLNVNITPILTGASIVGIALGFGAQTLFKDVIAGFFLIFENQIRVGDATEIDSIQGIVESIHL